MAKLTLRKRGVYGKRGAHVTNKFVKATENGRREYAIRSDNVLLRNDYWRSSFDGKMQSTGWKVYRRGIRPEGIIATLVEKGFTQ